MFIHSVYFWLRPDLSADDVQAFESGLNGLCNIETVRRAYTGTPAGTDRPIIDSSFTKALILVFDDQSAHDAYQVHPVHDDFREKCATFWSDIKIYDVSTP